MARFGCEGVFVGRGISSDGGAIELEGPAMATDPDEGPEVRKSSHAEEVGRSMELTPLACLAVCATDEPGPSKSRPDRRSMSGLVGLDGNRDEDGVLDAMGGGANGAGRGVGLLLSIDSSDAISSVLPPSMVSRSPTAFSRSGVDIDGTWSRKEKSSAENSMSPLSTLEIDCDVCRRDSRPKKRDTADGPGAGGGGEVAVDGAVGVLSAAADKTDGAGEAGLEDFELALPIEGRGSIVIGAGAGAGEADLTSSTPPPEVTSCFSAVGLRQNDHFDLVSSAC